jgi:hypothetical protein
MAASPRAEAAGGLVLCVLCVSHLVWGAGHSLSFRTSPGRSISDFRLIVSRCVVSAAAQSGGITCFTASTALAFATAATQSDLWPSGAMTSTTGILVRTFGMLGAYPQYLTFLGRGSDRRQA